MVLHSLSMCLLERVFLSNKSMPCKWDGDRPFGGKVLGPQSRPQSKGRTCGTQQPLAEASISLHCSRTKFLPEVCYDLWEICCLPCDLPSCTDTLGQTLSGCATRRTDPRRSHLPWERSNPRNQGEKDRFCIAHLAMRSPFHHFPKEAALQVQKVTPQSLLLTPIALGLPSFSLWKLLQWSICFQPTFHFLLTSESESLPIFPFPCRSDCRCYTTKASLFLQKSTPVQYEVL